MKKITVLCIIFTLGVLFLAACGLDAPIITGHSQSDISGVGIRISEVGGNEYAPVLRVEWYNRTEFDVTFGRGYDIERKDGDEWTSVLAGDLAVPEIAEVLSRDDSRVLDYVTDAFDIKKEGLYRIRVDFTLQRGAVAEAGRAYAEFKIKSRSAIFSHNLTLDKATEQRLADPLSDSYKEGERVTVRLKRDDNIGYSLVINGKGTAHRGIDTDEYYEYYFFMPGENAHVTLVSHDAYDEKSIAISEMIDIYLSGHGVCTRAEVILYYGRFIESGTAADVGIIGCECGSDDAVAEEWIGGHLFRYPSSNKALAFVNGGTYRLLEAYMVGYVSDADLEYIAQRHMSEYGYLYDGGNM